jgi:MFS family permease
VLKGIEAIKTHAPGATVVDLLAASGTGTMLVALVLPPILRRVPERTVMLIGGALLLIGACSAIALSTTSSDRRWDAALAIWLFIGAGMSLVLTPVGRVLRRSSTPADRPAVFAAQFSLSHMCWLLVPSTAAASAPASW